MTVTIDEMHSEVIADAPGQPAAAPAAAARDPLAEPLRLRAALAQLAGLQQRLAAEGNDD